MDIELWKELNVPELSESSAVICYIKVVNQAHFVLLSLSMCD